MKELDLNKLPTLSWDQKDTVKIQLSVIEAETKYLEALKNSDPKVLKQARLARRTPINWAPAWLTIWGVLVMSWVFILMTWRKDVFPNK